MSMLTTVTVSCRPAFHIRWDYFVTFIIYNIYAALYDSQQLICIRTGSVLIKYACINLGERQTEQITGINTIDWYNQTVTE